MAEIQQLGRRQTFSIATAGQDPISFLSLRLRTTGFALDEAEEGSVAIMISLRRKIFRFEGATPIITTAGDPVHFRCMDLPLDILRRPKEWQLRISQTLHHFAFCPETRQQVELQLLSFGLEMGRLAGVIGCRNLVITAAAEELVSPDGTGHGEPQIGTLVPASKAVGEAMETSAEEAEKEIRFLCQDL